LKIYEIFWNIWNFFGVYEIFLGFMGFFEIFLRYLGFCMRFAGLFWDLWDFLEIYGIFLGFFRKAYDIFLSDLPFYRQSRFLINWNLSPRPEI